MIPLLRTLFDIAILRRGPEHLPRSVVLLAMTVGLWLFAALATLALIERFDDVDFFLSVFSAFIGVICYAGIVYLHGHAERILQTTAAIVGVGALITLVFVAEYVLLMPFFGERTAGLVATLILFWSVPVEGHIIARAIDRHWYIGILVAMGVFILQFVINVALTTAR